MLLSGQALARATDGDMSIKWHEATESLGQPSAAHGAYSTESTIVATELFT